MAPFCEVVVNRPLRIRRFLADDYAPAPDAEPGDNPLAITFSYAVPQALQDRLELGQLVEVPFRENLLQAVVVGLSQNPPPGLENLRELVSILEQTPVLNAVQLELAHWLSQRYLAPLHDCIWPFLPPGSRRKPQIVADLVEGQTLPADVDARAAALFLYLQKHAPTPAAELDNYALQALLNSGAARCWQRLAPPAAGPLLDRTVELLASPEEIAAALTTLGRASKQADVLLYLESLDDPLPQVSQVLQAVGCSTSVIRSLAEKGWVSLNPRRSLVDTQLSASAMERALKNLKRAPVQRAALLLLQDQPNPQSTDDLDVSSSTWSALEKRGYCRRWTEPETVSLALDPDRILPTILQLRGAATHREVLDMLGREEGRVWVGWVYVQTEATLNTLRDLAAAGLVSLDETRRWRDPLRERSFALETPPQLSPEQAAAWETIREGIQRANSTTYLLHGVTGSGKTEIYLQAVAETLRQGRSAIFLVPEIALAAQTIQRVAARFPGKVAVWHSGLSLGERFDTWQRIRSGELPIVVGARSALFAPLPQPGLIVVDEEHEPAYKQAATPRYHSRELALEMGRRTNAVVILGSATPDVSSYRRAQRGEFTLLRLPRRVLAHRRQLARQLRTAAASCPALDGNQDLCTLPLPPVEVVSLSEELKAGNRSIFSRRLQEALRTTLADGQQALLFLNRRGAATFVMCRDCGHVMTCPSCQTPFTYHADSDQLVCHHCNRRAPIPSSCPNCSSLRIRYFGLGTERVEAGVRELFPQARLLRWDRDTARARGSHEAFLNHFVGGGADVLIGTQMVAKGLDMPRVTLVGVISADTALYLPDFRAAERSFQILVQVAGRAGRSPLGGRVIIQTYHPQLPLIKAAANHDYAAFYESELAARRDGGYPPFKRLARMVYVGSGAERAEREAVRMGRMLQDYLVRRGEPGVEIVGPAPCFYAKLRGKHRWQILVRADQPDELLRPLILPPGWRVDVDPVDLL